MPFESPLIKTVRPQVGPITRRIGEDPDVDGRHVVQADYLVALATISQSNYAALLDGPNECANQLVACRDDSGPPLH